MSTGLATAACGQALGQAGLGASKRLDDLQPTGLQASAHMILGPPALVTIPTRRPAGSGWLASSEATPNSSARLSVRITPAWWNRVSTVTSEAASIAPVWEEVALHAGGRATALDGEHGLGPSDPAGDPGELARIAERLEVQQHQPGAFILLPVGEQVVGGDVGLVADRHERRQPRPRALA